MALFITEALQLSPTQKGLMLSIPIFAGAFMRFPLGLMAQYIGRKNATLVEMGGISLSMAYGYFFVQSFNDLLAMGVLLGWPAPASAWPCRWARARSRPATRAWPWASWVPAMWARPSRPAGPSAGPELRLADVYGIAALSVAIPAAVMVVFAKEPADLSPHTALREHLSCLYERRLGLQPDLCRHLRRLRGPVGLSAQLFLRTIGVSKGSGWPAHHARCLPGRSTAGHGGWLSDLWGA
jgi:NNP family nitrate/nitrite transporter-like MFS transporter